MSKRSNRVESEAEIRMTAYRRRRDIAHRRCSKELNAADQAYDRGEISSAVWEKRRRAASRLLDRTNAALGRWILRGPH